MRITAAVAGVALCSLAFAAPAMGETFHVDSLGDASDPTTNTFCDTDIGGTDGTPCTLRAALDEANATSAADIIVFDITGTHTIASPLTVTQETTIDGNGSGTDGTVIDGNDAVKLFSTNVSDVTFEDIRLEDGAQSSGGLGPAAVEFGGDGTLINTTVTSNQITGTGSATGGAISAPAGSTLSLSDSTVSANTITLTGDAYGAGIYTDGALELTDSTVDGNTISAGGVEQGGGLVVVLQESQRHGALRHSVEVRIELVGSHGRVWGAERLKPIEAEARSIGQDGAVDLRLARGNVERQPVKGALT